MKKINLFLTFVLLILFIQGCITSQGKYLGNEIKKPAYPHPCVVSGINVSSTNYEAGYLIEFTWHPTDLEPEQNCPALFAKRVRPHSIGIYFYGGKPADDFEVLIHPASLSPTDPGFKSVTLKEADFVPARNCREILFYIFPDEWTDSECGSLKVFIDDNSHTYGAYDARFGVVVVDLMGNIQGGED